MYKRILVPVDGSPTSMRGLDEAIAIARSSNGEIRILNLIDDHAVALALEAWVKAATDWHRAMQTAAAAVVGQAELRVRAAGLAVSTVIFDVATGTLDEIVADEADRFRADAVVIGSHGRRGVRRLLLGSDAERIARTASVPVVIVHDTRSSRNDTLVCTQPSAAIAID